MCLLLRRRSQSSPLSCHSWIPSIYNQPLRDPSPQVPTGSDGSWVKCPCSLMETKALMASRGGERATCSSDALCPCLPVSALSLWILVGSSPVPSFLLPFLSPSLPSLPVRDSTAGAEVPGDPQPTSSAHPRPACSVLAVPGPASLLPVPSVSGSQELGLVSLTLCLLWGQ